VIGGFEKMKRRPISEFFYNGLDQPFAELITCAAEEEHRDRHARKVIRALCIRSSRRMEWERKQYESGHAFERSFGRCGRRHSSAERMPAGEQRQIR